MFCCFAELTIDSRPTGAERRLCAEEAAISKADEHKAGEAVNQSGDIDLENSSSAVGSLENRPITTPVSPGSPSMRHSASDSLVYRADVDLSSSSCDQVVADCLHSEHVTGGSSVGLNGYCRAAVDETCVPPQVCPVVNIVAFI